MNSYNNLYTNNTNNKKNPKIKATIGNPRFVFNEIELIVKREKESKYKVLSNTDPDKYKLLSEIDKKYAKSEEVLKVFLINELTTSGGGVVGGAYVGNRSLPNKRDFVVLSSSLLLYNNDLDKNHVASSFAHEIGHYFGLAHPFGNSSCTDNDEIADTPMAKGASWKIGSVNCDNPPTNCNGERRQVENIMDYGYCNQWIFTSGQVAVMHKYISKRSLLSNEKISTDSKINREVTVTVVKGNETKINHNELRKKRETIVDEVLVYPTESTEDFFLKSNYSKPIKVVVYNMMNGTLAKGPIYVFGTDGRIIGSDLKAGYYIVCSSIKGSEDGMEKIFTQIIVKK